MKGIATLTSSTVSLTVRESKELLMLLYRYDVDLVSLHKFLRKPYLRLRLLLSILLYVQSWLVIWLSIQPSKQSSGKAVISAFKSSKEVIGRA